MKISLTKSTICAAIAICGGIIPGALAQQNGPAAIPPDALFEIGPVREQTVLGCKTQVRDVRNAVAVRLSGVHESSRIVLKKGAKLSFRGNCNIQIAPNTLLLLEPESQLILKPGSSMSINTNCSIPAKQFFIVDPGKVLRSVGGVPTLYSS